MPAVGGAVRDDSDKVTAQFTGPSSPNARATDAGIRPVSFRVRGQPPQTDQDRDVFVLTEGVEVDTNSGRIYAMSPDGQVRAFAVSSGAQVWATADAAKPIGFAGNRVIAQVESSGTGNNLKIVALDPSTGKSTVRGSMALPSHINAAVDNTPKGQFLAVATPSDGSAVVTWAYEARSHRSLPPGTRSELPTPRSSSPAAAVPQELNSGAFRLNLATGAVATVDSGVSSILRPGGTLRELVESGERTGASRTASGEGGVDAAVSVDGRDILASKLTGKTADLEKYTLTVLSRATNETLGSFKSMESLVPFIVVGTNVIYQSNGYAARNGDRMEEYSPEINCVDLHTGKVLWSHPVRDTSYRGNFPP
jgi:outer membrane protein assembly factor BamB